MIPSQMLKGILQGSVLAILGQKETYGYEIVQDLMAYGFGHIAEGTIYPLLLRLEKSGLASVRYYALTDQGREALADFQASFREMTAAVERLPGFEKEEGA